MAKFDTAEFIKENLIRGYREGSFTKTRINIFALNYMTKGMITEEEFDYIMDSLEEPEEDNVEDEESDEEDSSEEDSEEEEKDEGK